MLWTQKMALLLVGVILVLVIVRVLPKNLEQWISCKIRNIQSLFDIKKMKIVIGATTVNMLVLFLYAWVNGLFLFDTSVLVRDIRDRFATATDTWLRPLIDPLFDANLNLPWLSGVWAIAFMIISVYCIVDVLHIEKKWAICLISALCASNSSVICQQEFAGGAHVGELALAFACIALWVITNNNISNKGKIIFGPIFMALSVGVYGAYVSVVPSIMLLLLMLDIMNGKSGKENWKKAFYYLFQFLLGMAVYYIILRTMMAITGGQLTPYMGEDNIAHLSGIENMFLCIPKAYTNIIMYYGAHSNYFLPEKMEWLLCGIMLFGGFMTLNWMYVNRKQIKDKKMNIALLVTVILLLPMAINFIDIVSLLQTHYLMAFTYVIPLLFFVKLIQDNLKISTIQLGLFKIRVKRISVLVCVLLCVFVYYSTVIANGLYTRYLNTYDFSLSLGTRILDRIETCEGFNGTEEIVLIGDMQGQEEGYFDGNNKNKSDIFQACLGTASDTFPKGIYYGFLTQRFLENILDSSLEYEYFYSILDYKNLENHDEELAEQLENMRDFPHRDSVKKIGDTIFVVFSHNKN